METKNCTDCHKLKPLSEYYNRNNHGRILKMSKCKDCSKEMARAWARENRERFNKYQKEYRAEYTKRKNAKKM